jgi:hypothetical protein
LISLGLLRDPLTLMLLQPMFASDLTGLTGSRGDPVWPVLL